MKSFPKNVFQKVFSLSILSVFLFLSGCLSLQQDIELKEDLSGKMVLVLKAANSRPELTWEQQGGFLGSTGILDSIKKVEGLTLTSNTLKVKGEDAIQTLIVKFDAVDAFKHPALREVHPLVFGMQAEKDENGMVHFTHLLNLDSLEGENGIDPFFLRMFHNLYASTKWNYSVKLPGTVSDSLSNGVVQANMVSWEVSFSEVLQEKINMQASGEMEFLNEEMQFYLIRGVILLAVLLLVVLGVSRVFRAFRKPKIREETEPKSDPSSKNSESE